MRRTRFIAYAGIIAATYAAVTLLVMFLLQSLAWGPIQFRLSEALTVLPVVTSAAIPGLGIGCVLANVIGAMITGTGALGLFDIVFGSLATVIGAVWARRFRRRTAIALLGPVLANALIVPAYLPVLLKAVGFYTIPFTNISVTGSYLGMYLFGVVTVGIGEAVVVYGLGLPLLAGLRRLGLFDTDNEEVR